MIEKILWIFIGIFGVATGLWIGAWVVLNPPYQEGKTHWSLHCDVELESKPKPTWADQPEKGKKGENEY